MKALAPKEPRQLPSNFPYLTMRRIKEQQRMEERRQHLMAIVTTIAVALAGIAALVVGAAAAWFGANMVSVAAICCVVAFVLGLL